jgi:hypothetical protein
MEGLQSYTASQGTFDENTGIWDIGTLGVISETSGAILTINTIVNEAGDYKNIIK